MLHELLVDSPPCGLGVLDLKRRADVIHDVESEYLPHLLCNSGVKDLVPRIDHWELVLGPQSSRGLSRFDDLSELHDVLSVAPIDPSREEDHVRA